MKISQLVRLNESNNESTLVSWILRSYLKNSNESLAILQADITSIGNFDGHDDIFDSVNDITISRCNKLTSLESFPKNMKECKHVYIRECPALTSLNGIPTSVIDIEIFKAAELLDVNTMLRNLPKLQMLHIIGCPKLTDVDLSNNDLNYLYISGINIRKITGINKLKRLKDTEVTIYANIDMSDLDGLDCDHLVIDRIDANLSKFTDIGKYVKCKKVTINPKHKNSIPDIAMIEGIQEITVRHDDATSKLVNEVLQDSKLTRRAKIMKIVRLSNAGAFD